VPLTIVDAHRPGTVLAIGHLRDRLTGSERFHMGVALTHDEAIFTLHLGSGENRFSLAALDEIAAALDEVEASAPAALITTASGKFFSNGLDLEWLIANTGEVQMYIGRIHDLLARMCAFPVPTVCAVNGHAFGAGAMLAMAHDFRVMRRDRGFFCFPEVDINIPFTPGMAALIQAKISPQTAVAAMTTGRRFGGVEAARVGLVDACVEENGLTATAAEYVIPLVGKHPDTLRAIKNTMFAQALAALELPLGADGLTGV